MTDYNGVSCPRCHKTDKFVIIADNNHKFLKCERCNHQFIDEELETAYGVRKCDDGSYETDGWRYKLFPCPYCMVFYYTSEAEQKHRHKEHKVGDYMACMEV